MINWKFWRKKRRLTRAKLAAITGTSQNYIYEIETFRKNPSPKMLNKLISALDICIIIKDAQKCDCPYKNRKRNISCKHMR